MTETMTPEQYRAERAKPAQVSASLKTARLFAFQCRARRLPPPRWKENGGELRFAGELVDLPRRKAMKRKQAPLWKFDFCWPEQRIAVEIEGIVTRKLGDRVVSMGGHTDPEGFNDDCEKYAWAAVLGWRLVRFTPQQVKQGFAIDMVVRLFAALQPPGVLISGQPMTDEALAKLIQGKPVDLRSYDVRVGAERLAVGMLATGIVRNTDGQPDSRLGEPAPASDLVHRGPVPDTTLQRRWGEHGVAAGMTDADELPLEHPKKPPPF